MNYDKESLECLCSLLTSIVKDFDSEKAKPWMDQYFRQIQKIVREGKMATRTRDMLQDIMDLRLNNWVSRGPEQGPKPIYHKEAKTKDKEEPTKVQPQMDKKIQQVPWAKVIMQYRKKAQEAQEAAERCTSFVLA
ncbi:eukaryotic translation initiation factor 4 gamma 3 [Pleuronectes platessa]|uniref:eukaryotic translation initiation factor 4 gamma 3 n=1 Tax=Pleuronectes platessa TaxID=8262 RepID=UPI00232A27C8|nr:eukaryotic translation initiation factor 4 gamma 3 [Pleuronectes platessa]